VRGNARDGDAGAEIETGPKREPENALDWYDCVFLSGAAQRAVVCGKRDPDRVTDREAIYPRAEFVYDAGAIMVRDGLARRVADSPPTGFPVSGVDARHENANPNFARSRLWNRPIDKLNYRRVTVLRVDGCSHVRTLHGSRQLFVFLTVWRGSMVMSWVTDVHRGQTELVEEARLHLGGRYMTCRPDLLARPSGDGSRSASDL
jgi:hypothetical protein